VDTREGLTLATGVDVKRRSPGNFSFFLLEWLEVMIQERRREEVGSEKKYSE
jgi:hypothetical protein